MKVYVLYFRDTYVDINGSVDPDDVVGVFSSVEKIAEFMKQEDGWHPPIPKTRRAVDKDTPA